MGKLSKTVQAMMFLAVLTVQPVAAGNDVIITRDGTLVKAIVYKVAGDITYSDLNAKDGLMVIPTTKVYMVLRDKGSSLYFDEDGKQKECPTVKLVKNTDQLFLNDGKVITVYDLSISNGEVTYKLDKKYTTPTRRMPVSELFMVKSIDGSTMLLNQKATAWAKKPSTPKTTQPAPVQHAAVKEEPAQGGPVTLPAKDKIPVISVAAATAAVTPTVQPKPAVQPAAPVQPDITRVTQEAPVQSVLPAEPAPSPAPMIAEVAATAAPLGMSVYELEKKVRAKEPYALHRNNAMVEYRFQQGGYMIAYEGKTTFLQQTVSSFAIENGLLRVNQTQEYYNKKHAHDKATMEALKGSLFYVEIDQDGNSLLSHNLMHDFIRVSGREGYGVILPCELTPGMSLQCGTVKDSGTDLRGRSVTRTLTYRGWHVESEEYLQTEAGVLPCMKITGQVSVNTSTGTSMVENVTCWVSRGIGFVRYDSAVEGSGNSKPVILALVGMKNVK